MLSSRVSTSRDFGEPGSTELVVAEFGAESDSETAASLVNGKVNIITEQMLMKTRVIDCMRDAFKIFVVKAQHFTCSYSMNLRWKHRSKYGKKPVLIRKTINDWLRKRLGYGMKWPGDSRAVY
jgi:hypothetical protein